MGIFSGSESGTGVLTKVLVSLQSAGAGFTVSLTSFHSANNQTSLTTGARDFVARQTGGATPTVQGPERYNTRTAGNVGANFISTWVTQPTDIANALLYIPRISNTVPGFHQWSPPNPRYPIILNENELISLEASDGTRPYTSTMNYSQVDYEKSSMVSTPIRGRRARDAGYMGFYGQNGQAMGQLTGRPPGNTQFFSVCNRIDASAWQDTQIPWNLNLYGAAGAVKRHFLSSLGVGA